MAELTDKKITQSQADDIMAPMELDLISIFKVMEEDFLETVDGYEGTPEQFIEEISKTMIDPGQRIEKSIKPLKIMEGFLDEFPAYMGPAEDGKHYIVHQDDIGLDSIMVHYDSSEQAEKDYLEQTGRFNFSAWLQEVSMEELKEILQRRKSEVNLGADVVNSLSVHLDEYRNGRDDKKIMFGLLTRIVGNFKERYGA